MIFQCDQGLIREPQAGFRHLSGTMQYRFITPNRIGKWYPELKLAMKQAAAIGAGYYDKASGQFFKYRDTQLQVRNSPDDDAPLAA